MVIMFYPECMRFSYLWTLKVLKFSHFVDRTAATHITRKSWLWNMFSHRWTDNETGCTWLRSIITRCRPLRYLAGLKRRLLKGRMNFLVKVNGHLAQWDRLGFLDWNQRPTRKVTSIAPMTTCTWPRRAFRLENIDCGLIYRRMCSARFACPKHDTHEWNLFCFNPNMWREVIKWSVTQRP